MSDNGASANRSTSSDEFGQQTSAGNPLRLAAMISGGFVAFLVVAWLLPSCFTNNPYPRTEDKEAIYYTTFVEEPKYLDPATAYSGGAFGFMNLVYEAPLDYHYLKRPYELIPLVLAEVPEPQYYDADGKLLEGDPPADIVEKVVYELRVRPGIMFQDHPAFAMDAQGNHVWHLGPDGDLGDIEHPLDLAPVGTREMTAADLAYQFKRLAHPLLQCPIFPTLARSVAGYREYSDHIAAEIKRIRTERREKAGAFYNQERDEEHNPVYIDLREHDFPGVEVADDRTMRIVLSRKYPQMKYWLTLSFFAPMPWEVDRFFTQAAAAKRNITLNKFPTGTGPYILELSQANWRMVLARNPRYAGRQTYPTEGGPGDLEKALLEDAGKPLPFIDKIVYVLEKESMPRWNKFLQGYYDASGVASDLFDQVITMSDQGSGLSDSLVAQGIRLESSAAPRTSYYCFNMLDDVVGGYTKGKRALRQAISIAFDTEEHIQIFFNGRGVPSHGLIPPMIPGHLSGPDGYNDIVYEWDERANTARRRPIERAKELLSQAGYPGGIGPDGNPLVLYYDTASSRGEDKALMDWLRKQFAKIGIQLQVRVTDFNQFQTKAAQGSYQILRWGWSADYPDAENFMFLLYGPNGVVRSQGANNANYDSPEYNALFGKMESMEDSPERMRIIRKMTQLLREDAPWFGHFHPVAYGLYHQWLLNSKPSPVSRGTAKYQNIDTELRTRRRTEWNRPVTWPIWALVFIAVITIAPAAIRLQRRRKEGGE